jgi:hypothetical protein
MPTQPIEEILPLSKSEPEISNVLGRFGNLIDEAVYFGTHVLKWHLESTRGGDETVPVTLSFRHILELLYCVSLNIRRSLVDPCKLLLRGALESFFGVAYILEADTNRRSMAFMATYANQRMKTYRKLDPSTDQGKEFARLIKKDRIAANMVLTVPPSLVRSSIANLESLLKRPEYKDANAEYQRMRKTGTKNPYWYSLYGGPKNVEKLADHLGLVAMYHILYRQWSSSTHGTDIIHGKISQSETGHGAILQLRLPTEAQTLTVLAVSLALELYQLFINRYAPDKANVYKSWYKKEIRPVYVRLTGEKIILIKL